MRVITIDKKEVDGLKGEEDFKEMMKKKLMEAKDEVV